MPLDPNHSNPQNQFLATMLELSVNRILNLDLEAAAQLKQFDGKVIQFQVTDFDVNLFLLFPAGAFVVQTQTQKTVSAAISGKLGAYLSTVSSDHVNDAMFNGELSFSGEINTARKFQTFIQSLDPDWIRPLSELFGEVVAQNLALGIKQMSQFAKQFVTTIGLDIPEYLQHEIQGTPSTIEMNALYQQIDLTRSQTDRLNARIERLLRHD